MLDLSGGRLDICLLKFEVNLLLLDTFIVQENRETLVTVGTKLRVFKYLVVQVVRPKMNLRVFGTYTLIHKGTEVSNTPGITEVLGIFKREYE